MAKAILDSIPFEMVPGSLEHMKSVEYRLLSIATARPKALVAAIREVIPLVAYNKPPWWLIRVMFPDMLINRQFLEEASHKTVIVLDQASVFSMEQHLTVSIRNDKGETISGSFAKTLWNYSVEAILEFHRVVADLFPFGNKQMRLVLSDFDGHFFSTPWKSQLIKYDEVLKSLSHCHRSNPLPSSSNSAESGHSTLVALKLAVEGISDKTSFQQQGFEKSSFNGPAKKKSLLLDPNSDAIECESNFENRGNIVVLTKISSLDDYIELFENCQMLIKKMPQRENKLRIDHLNLIVVNVLDCGKTNDPNFTKLGSVRTMPTLSARLVSVIAGSELISCMHSILMDIFDLMSTMISGIPMKQDTQPKNVVNYSVELLHSKNAHERLAANGLLQSILSNANCGMYRSTRLSWSSNVGSQDKKPIFQESYPVTPVSIGSLVTDCLTNYVQTGRIVMLEAEGEGYLSKKLVSHALNQSNVTGQIMMQCIAFDYPSTWKLEEKLAMSEIEKSEINFPSMLHLMTCSELIPVPNLSVDQTVFPPNASQRKFKLDSLCHNVQNLASYFVISSRDSEILGKPEFQTVFSILQKPVVEGKDFVHCSKFIREFLASKKFQANGVNCEECPLGEQRFRSVCDEFAKLLKNFAHISSAHEIIFNQFKKAAGIPARKSGHPLPTTKRQQPMVKGVQLQQKPMLEKKSSVSRKRGLPIAAESEEVGELQAKRPKTEDSIVMPKWLDGMDLLEFFNNLYELRLKAKSKSKEFVGREKYGDNARRDLYPQLNFTAATVLKEESQGPEKTDK